MVSENPAKFGGHRHCDSRDLMFLVVKGEDSRCPCLNLQITAISNLSCLKHMAGHAHTH